MEEKSSYKRSIYDVSANPSRKGVSGWKLTKKLATLNESPGPNIMIGDRNVSLTPIREESVMGQQHHFPNTISN